jgi:hypothetical protein
LLIITRNVLKTRNLGFLTAIPENYSAEQGVSYSSELSETRRLETVRKIARQKVDRLEGELVQMETALHIERRWDATVPAYMETLSYMARRQYQQSLDLLQKLVTQRLFELHRLNVGGIGALSPSSQPHATDPNFRLSGTIYDFEGDEIEIEGHSECHC